MRREKKKLFIFSAGKQHFVQDSAAPLLAFVGALQQVSFSKLIENWQRYCIFRLRIFTVIAVALGV